MNENEYITHQNLLDASKTRFRGKFVTIKTYIEKEERPPFNNLNFYIKALEEELIKPKTKRRKENKSEN